jgi:hypothetical protein
LTSLRLEYYSDIHVSIAQNYEIRVKGYHLSKKIGELTNAIFNRFSGTISCSIFSVTIEDGDSFSGVLIEDHSSISGKITINANKDLMNTMEQMIALSNGVFFIANTIVRKESEHKNIAIELSLKGCPKKHQKKYETIGPVMCSHIKIVKLFFSSIMNALIFTRYTMEYKGIFIHIDIYPGDDVILLSRSKMIGKYIINITITHNVKDITPLLTLFSGNIFAVMFYKPKYNIVKVLPEADKEIDIDVMF